MKGHLVKSTGFVVGHFGWMAPPLSLPAAFLLVSGPQDMNGMATTPLILISTC